MFGVIQNSSAFNIIRVIANGSSHQLTNSFSDLNFGGQDPIITLNPGRYIIISHVQVEYNGATFLSSQDVNFKLKRVNNNAIDVSASVGTRTMTVTTLTAQLDCINLPTVVYDTTNFGDSITIQGMVDNVPSVGSLDVSEAELLAIKL